ncbi:MAG: HepT-like ribonuclease domain-containing protein [Planctomycetota bacterium]|jgi:uncharacterized protein with HEPN domain
MEADRFCLIHMAECIRRVEHYVEGGRGAFMSSTLVQDAVLWNVQLISAAALRVSQSEKMLHPEVAWAQIGKTFREIARDPWQLDEERLWRCTDEELPVLRRGVQALLRPVTGGF